MSISHHQPCREIKASELELDLQHDLIGHGGFASVYAAIWWGHQVAIKLVSLSEDDIAKLKKEIGLLASLNHPGIIRVFGITYIDKSVGIVMERASGSLHVPSSLTPVTLSHAKAITSTIAYLHAQGFIHRDLKPQNILMVDGQPKISDFETSKIISNTTTSTSINSFTPKYAALEVFDHAAVQASDVYSLAVVLYELLSNQIAFKDSSNISLFADKFKGIKLPSNVEMPLQLINIINKCLDNDPKSRPSIGEILDVLNNLDGGAVSSETSELEHDKVPALRANSHSNQKIQSLEQTIRELEQKNQELLDDAEKQKEYTSKMDNCFNEMNQKVKDLNRIKKKIDAKDQKIQQLSSENQELKLQIQNLTNESGHLSNRTHAPHENTPWRKVDGSKCDLVEKESDSEHGEESLSMRCHDAILEHFKQAVNQVDLRFQNLTENQVVTISSALAVNQNIQCIYLADTNINDSGALSIAQCLRTNVSLTSLDLTENSITHIGCDAIADALACNSTLRVLSLEDNPIGNQGIEHLAKALKSNKSLEKIGLANTNCGYLGAIALGEALKINTVLAELDLQVNQMEDQAAEIFAQAMTTNSKVKLVLGDNNLSEFKKSELNNRFKDRICV
ncbi:hypothetical protein P9112_013842 [Eukaryota sp. TZLM1-RC]